MDHLESPEIEIVPFYFDHKKNPYKISKSQLYSNTPSDFDFKLQESGSALSEKELVSELKKCDIAFPAMHGPYGEDGGIQGFLEKNKIPFVGTGSESCKKSFDKFNANESIKKMGFFTLPSVVLKINKKDHGNIIHDFFKLHNIKRAVVKPATGGSSIGVFSVSTPQEALERSEFLFSKRMDTRVVIEQFATGSEFTVIILQNKYDLPVAIIPTEIEADYTEHQIFDFRKKYLPTRQVTYHCPPRFSNQKIEEIQVQAEQLFSALGMRDFARFDGWVLPDGKIWFSDFNPISGMEQNSFLFQQGARVGLSHRSILLYILAHACKRNNIDFAIPAILNEKNRKEVSVLFGGSTSERQVSLMSGTNIWLKLRKSKKYSPKPYLLDFDGNVWELPYALTLNHTVEEIVENCLKAPADEERLRSYEKKAQVRLSIDDSIPVEDFFLPRKMTLAELINRSKFIFIGLHGGFGEDGKLQALLERNKVKFNGPDSKVSALCMNKFATGEVVEKVNIPGLATAKKRIISTETLKQKNAIKNIWKEVRSEFGSDSIIIKPMDDGCSSGVVRLYGANDLEKYLDLVTQGSPFIPRNTFKNQPEIVDLPQNGKSHFLLEEFIVTDQVIVKGNDLIHKVNNSMIEITVGVVEEKGKLIAFNPSLTVAEGEVLSVEEKFQGGTGINITPPPEEIIENKNLIRIKELIEIFAKKIGIKGYSRIDTFANTKTGDLIIIEVNTLPGLTPSTVLYHQALAEKTPIYPRELLEKLIENKGY